MPVERSDFLRRNAFLLAAIALPAVVVAFFLVASALPRWTVPPPQYDLLLSGAGPHQQGRPRVTVEYKVRDGQVEAVVRPALPNTYAAPSELFLFDHTTSSVRKIPLDLPELKETDPPKTIRVEALAGHRVVSDTRAPDGYELESRTRGGSGIVGELFGMNRYDQGFWLAKRGRIVRLTMPFEGGYAYGVSAVGWVLPAGTR